MPVPEPPDDTPIPKPLYPCSGESCERAYQASSLYWIPAWAGWYCDDCIDDRGTDEHGNDTVEIGVRMAAWLQKRNSSVNS